MIKIIRTFVALALCVFLSGANAQVGLPFPGPGTAHSAGGACTLSTPQNILGGSLTAWWDASDTAHMVFVGSNISSWTDKIGGFAATNSNLGQQPAWSATAKNGKPGVILTAANGDELALGSTTGFPVVDALSTIFIGGFSNAQTNATAFGYGTNSSNQLRQILITSGNVISGFDGATVFTVGGSIANTDYSFLWQVGGGSSAVALNGGTATTVGASTESTSLFQGSIGNFVGTNYDGVIKQVILVSGSTTTSQRNKLAGWESWNDGMNGSNLAAGNPFISHAPCVSDP